MSQNQTSIPENKIIEQYKSDFLRDFGEICIFRALSLVDIAKKVRLFPSEPIIYSDGNARSSKVQLGYHYANIENNEIIRSIITRGESPDIYSDLKAPYGKIIVLFENNIFWDISKEYEFIELQIFNNNVLKKCKIGKFIINRNGHKNIEILTIEQVNGMEMPYNSVIVFKSDVGIDFTQLAIATQNMNLVHTTEECPKYRKFCNNVTFPEVKKMHGISYAYGQINNIEEFKREIQSD